MSVTVKTKTLPTYQAYQSKLLRLGLMWISRLMLVGISVNCLWFLWDFWGTLIQNTIGLIVIVGSWWTAKKVEGGSTFPFAKIYAYGTIVISSLLTILLGQQSIGNGVLASTIFILMATIIGSENPSLKWGFLSVFLYWGALTFRILHPVFEFSATPSDIFSLYFFPTLFVLLFTFVSRGIIGTLKASLTTSEQILLELEDTNKRLEAELDERLRIDAELKKYREELEELVQARTVELQSANEQLLAEIEARKQIQEALVQERALLDTVMNNTPDCIAAKDVESRFTLVNTATVQQLGMTMPDQVIGKTDFDFHPQELASQYYADEQQLLRSGQPLIDHEEPLLNQVTGRIGWALTTKVPLRDSHGNIVGLVVTARDITERKRTELQIKASLEEKEALLKEVHHRVKNNLQIIASMLNMQTRYTENEQIMGQLLDSRNRVYSMALVHENLYRSETLAWVDIAAYVSDLVGNLLQSYGFDSRRIGLKLDVQQIFLSLDQAVPCGLIINELVSNALKYAFPETMAQQRSSKDEITIAFYSGEDEMLVLTVADNGVGLPEGLDLNTSKTLGLRLVRTLVRQLDATLAIDAESGTKFSITFRKGDEDRKAEL
ncbi:MAG: PAS domain-containing protein [Anaerolineaceae bacterium]|nr:PAS domain-containing protein [Anaerolineaceae bacterium]